MESAFVCDILMACSLECEDGMDCTDYFKEAANVALRERVDGVYTETKASTSLENMALALALVGTRELDVYLDALILMDDWLAHDPVTSSYSTAIVQELVRYAVDGKLMKCTDKENERALWELYHSIPVRLRAVYFVDDMFPFVVEPEHVKRLELFVPTFFRWATEAIVSRGSRDERIQPTGFTCEHFVGTSEYMHGANDDEESTEEEPGPWWQQLATAIYQAFEMK